MTPDEERIDAGRAYLPGGSGPIKPAFCGRGQCGGMAIVDHDFCGPCLAWLRGDEPVDPLPAQEATSGRLSSWVAGPYPPADVDDEEWYEYLSAARSRYG